MRPIVIVIENPDGEPTTYTVGDVELVELSSYPATGYAAEDRRAGSYDGYSDKLRSLAERVAAIDASHEAVGALRELAARFDAAAVDDS